MARAGIYSLVLVLLSMARAVAVEAVWIGPAVGAWNVPANWSTGVVPNFNTAVRIDDNVGQSTRVESRVSASSNLVMIDQGDTLAVINSTFNAFASVDGTLSVEGNNAQLNAAVLLNPGGELRLAGTSATATLTFVINQGEVHGGGRLTLSNGTTPTTSYNNGTIRGDNLTFPLIIQLPTNANFENNGRMIATGGGKLQIQQGFISGTPVALRGGRIEAHPGSSVVLGTNTGSGPVAVEDAVLAMVEDTDPLTTAPAFQFNAKLTDVTLEGNFKLSGTDIVGTLRNPGEISPGTTTVATNWHNDLIGEVLLTGGGTVQLGSSPYALFGTPQSSSATGYRLINVDNVIRGSSELLVSWGGFTNRHIVQADAAGELVFFNGFSPDGFVNSGVMKAINGGRLRLGYQGGGTQATLQNFEGGDTGEIIAGENSTVALANIRIKGGVLRTEGSSAATRGKYVADGLVILEDATLEGSYRFLTSAGALSTITLEKKNYNRGSLTGRFAVATSAELAGGGEIVGEGGNILSLSQGSSFINSDNLIHGTGTISVLATSSTETRLTNRGTIRADGPITFSSSGFPTVVRLVNRGRIEAGPGATLAFPTSSTVTVLNSEDGVAGTIHAATGGVVTFRNIDGGILSTEGSGVIRASSGGVLKDVHNLGTLEVTSVQPQGTIVNDGVIKGSMQLTGAYVRFNGIGRWEGGAGSFSGIAINGPQHTILGNGDLGSSSSFASSIFENEGTLRTGEVSQTFRLFAGSFENSGLIHAPAGRTLVVSSAMSRAENNGTLQVDGNIDVTAAAGLYNEIGGVIDVRGTLSLNETRLRNRGGKLTGDGQIVGPMASGPLVVNEGVIEPGPGLATLSIGDDFQQLASGQLKMEVSGGISLSSDLLEIEGSASLTGALAVTRVGDAALVAGDAFTLLSATGGVAGQFQQLSMPTLASDLFWYVHYTTNNVQALVVDVIPGDFNRNGSVGGEDYVLWRKNGGTPQEYSDWVANFGRTIDLGEPAEQSQVPEPANCWLLLAAGAVRLARGRQAGRKK